MDRKILNYIIGIAIVLISIPITDIIIKNVLFYLGRKNFVKYKNVIGNAFIIIFIRLAVFTLAFLLALSVSGVSLTYIMGALGVLSIMLPLTLQTPAQDFVCGILLIAFDKIRIGELVVLKDINDYTGICVDIQSFSTQFKNPLTQSLIEIPNHKLWSMNINTLSRSPRQRIVINLLVSNRNNIGVIENVIRKILFKKSYIKDLDFSYVSDDVRGLGIEVAVITEKTIDDGVKFLKTQNELYKFLKEGLQKYGIIFVDGSAPVSLKHKSNVVTPLIVNSFTEKELY